MTAAPPLIILGLGVAVLLTVITIHRSHLWATATAKLALVIALISIPFARHAPASWPDLFDFGPLALGLIALILVSAALILAIGYAYWQKFQQPREEFSLLLLIATLGACTLAASASFITLFLGLETMTLAMIGMIAYPRDRPNAEEAALKYLVLSGMSSAFLLFGIGLIELSSGSLGFSQALAAPATPLLVAGLAMIGVGAGFKLSVVPFHIWVPDIYAGAPAPAGAYIAVIPKLAVFAVLIRLQEAAGVSLPAGLFAAITAIAILSMLIGYLLVAWLPAWGLAIGSVARVAVVFYLVTYAITLIGAFGVIAILSAGEEARDSDRVADLRGLFWTRPALAAALTMILLSLAGIPPAIGFIAKMYIFAAGIHTNLWLLIGTMVASSVIGLFYYLTIIIVMAQRPGAEVLHPRGIAWSSRLSLAALGACVVGFGIAPQPLIMLVKAVLF
jgi:NADH-quinone oxidoreductase subunit N